MPTTVSVPRKVAATVTANATLAKGRHTPVDATAGARTMTLPTDAAAGVEVAVEKIDATTNAVTISGTFRGTASTLTLTTQFEARTFLSEGGGSWRPTSDHRTAASLSASFLPRAGLDVQVAAGETQFHKLAGDGRAAGINFINDDSTGYTIHCTLGSGSAGTSAAGFGTNPDSISGNAMIVSNKGATTHGIRLISQPTSVSGYGLYGTSQGQAGFVFLESATGAGGSLVNLSDASGALATAAGKVQQWGISTGTIGEVMAADGTLRWRKDVNAWASTGTAPRFVAASASTTLATAHQAVLDGSVQGLNFYRYSGTSGSWYAARITANATRTLAVQLAFTAAAQGAESLVTGMSFKAASATVVQVGLYGSTPVSQPARLGQLTNNSGGTSSGATIAAVTDVPTAANAIATLAAKVNALEAALSAAGGGIGVTA